MDYARFLKDLQRRYLSHVEYRKIDVVFLAGCLASSSSTSKELCS